MDRSAVWTGEIPRSYDLLKGWRRAYIGLGFALTDTIGGFEDSAAGTASTGLLGDNLYSNLADHGGGTAASPVSGTALYNVVGGFRITPAFPTGLKVTINPGSIYLSMKTDFVQATATAWLAAQTSGAAAVAALSAAQPIDAGTLTGFGDIAADATAEAAQFIIPAAVLTCVKPGSGSNFYLIEAVPVTVDETAADDPNVSASSPYNAVLPYFNAANPSLPLQGPGGTNPPTQQPSMRSPTGLTQFSANSPQTTAAALTLDSGAIPLYVIQVESTDTSIAAARVWGCGLGGAPAVGGAVIAPFLRGLMQQHHLGVAGSAPQIDGGKEWLPLSAVDNNGQVFNNQARVIQNATGPGTLVMALGTDVALVASASTLTVNLPPNPPVGTVVFIHEFGGLTPSVTFTGGSNTGSDQVNNTAGGVTKTLSAYQALRAVFYKHDVVDFWYLG